MSLENNKILEVKNISTSYGQINAIKNISLEIHRVEIVTLLGSNGAGKTTTLHTISGLLQPKSGEILFNGQPIHKLAPHKITKLGLAQSPEARLCQSRPRANSRKNFAQVEPEELQYQKSRLPSSLALVLLILS